MTESGCATSGHIINYTKLGGGITFHAENVTGILCAISPGARIYCRGDALLLFASGLTGNDGNLWTRLNGNASSKDYMALDCDCDKLVYNNQVISFNSAGNNGNNSGNISSPDRGFNVNTVGAYDDGIDTIYLDNASGNVRVVLDRLNDAHCTYTHRTDAHPMDMDSFVVASNGKQVGSSVSFDNSYEMVNFYPQLTGTYMEN
ncbi:MAG: hypothetical protein K0U59_00620 [Gammaproteobacteria bacterium]|nr:hypothetical protein [Gammaproteobacteria bacterium]